MTVISPEDAVARLPDWAVVDGRPAIRRTFRFGDFITAFGFMTRVAILAEKADHHPEWSNVYNRGTIRWTTHSEGGVTELDVKLARACSRFAAGG